MAKEKPLSPWREKVFIVIFEADTYWGKVFDISLLVFILASVLAVMLETVAPIEEQYGSVLKVFEWIFTIYFTAEYVLRLVCVRRPWKYATSFFGIIDLLAILPKYLSLIFVGTHYLAVIRALRLLRVFRIFKLAHFMNESTIILRALKASRAKITVFLVFILLVVMILGSLMYLIEGGEIGTGFTSIPRSVYWAIVTLTTVGYGDIAPGTPFGQFVASFIMIMGYAVLAVPTGIVTAEFANIKNEHELTTITCNSCANEGHDADAEFCKYCGTKL
jgi:voltage-gated potassium channel